MAADRVVGGKMSKVETKEITKSNTLSCVDVENRFRIDYRTGNGDR